jgi:hypothetical protein
MIREINKKTTQIKTNTKKKYQKLLKILINH